VPASNPTPLTWFLGVRYAFTWVRNEDLGHGSPILYRCANEPARLPMLGTSVEMHY
jgi:hypothetical protein